MREIVLDTETTGFEPGEGDRIVEIGAVELVNHMPTGRTYHQYINPMRSMPEGAFGVHGIGPDLLEPPRPPEPGQVILKDKPVFADVAQAFIADEWRPGRRPNPLPPRISEAEATAHAAFVDKLGDEALWKKLS